MTTFPRRPGRQRIGVAASLAGATVLVAACIGSEPVTSPGSATADAISQLLVTCGGPAFPRAALSGPIGAEGLDDPAAGALRVILNDPGIDAAMLPDDGWRLVRRDAASALFIADSEPEPGAIEAGEPHLWEVSISSSGGGWRADGWGQCNPQVALGGGIHAGRWGFHPNAPPPNANATELAVIVEEIECADGPPGDRVLPPLIDYAPDSITIVARLRDLPPGTYPCPGIPGTPVVFDLEEPLGDRALLDGVNFPARPPELMFPPP
jgi:hypothetical protein